MKQGARLFQYLAVAVFAAAAGMVQGAEATTPSLSASDHNGKTYAATLDMNNDGTWAAVLTVQFNTPMAFHTDQNDALQEIVINVGVPTTNVYSPVRGSAIEFDANSVKVFYLPPQEEGLRLITESYSSLYISGTALKSADTGTALAEFGQLGPYASGADFDASDSAVRWQSDSAAPSVASATLDRDSRTLRIVSDESLALGEYRNVPTSSVEDFGALTASNVTKFHIRDGPSGTSGQAMSGAGSLSLHGEPVHEIRFVLTQAQLTAVAGYTDPHLHIEAEGIGGMGSGAEPRVDLNAAIAEQINYLPRISAAQLDAGARTLSLTFDEQVTKGSGSFYIRDSQTGQYLAATDVLGTLETVSGTAGSANLTATHVATVEAMSTPHLHLYGGAVEDSGGAANAYRTVSLTVTNAEPSLSAATIDRASRQLTLTFNKAVAAGTGNIDIRDGAGATYDASRDVRIAAGTFSFAGNSATAILSSADLTKAAQMADPRVYLDASVVTGPGSRGNAALTAGHGVVFSPQLASAALAPETGELSATFSEPVAAVQSSRAVVYAAPSGDTDGFTAGTDVRLHLSGTASSHAATITAAELGRILAMSSPRLYAEAGAVEASGLANGANSVALAVAAPAVSSATINYATGAVAITFTYAVSAGSGNIELVNSASAQYDSSTHVRVPVSGAAVSGSQVTFTLSAQDRLKAVAMGSSLWLRLPAGAVSGVGGNEAAARPFDTPSLPALYDGGRPYAGTLDMNNDGTWAAVLTLSFDTPLRFQTGEADALAGIAVKAGAEVDPLRGAEAGSVRGSAIEVDGSTVKIFYPPSAEDKLRMIGESHVSLYVSGTALESSHTGEAVAEFGRQGQYESGALFADSGTALLWTGDVSAPQVASAALGRDSGTLSIVADESLAFGQYSRGSEAPQQYDATVPSANATKFHIRDGEQATSGLSMSDSNAPSVHGSPVHEIRFVLTPAQLATALGYAAPHLHVEASAFDGISGGISAIHKAPNEAVVKPLVLRIDVPDTTPPLPPLISTAQALISSSTYQISGTAEAGSLVTVTGSVNAGSATTVYSTKTATAAAGAWQVTLDIAEGLNEIRATAADPSGNESTPSDPLYVTKDTTPPYLESAEINDRRTITVVFSEPVSAGASSSTHVWTLSGSRAGGLTVPGHPEVASSRTVDLAVSDPLDLSAQDWVLRYSSESFTGSFGRPDRAGGGLGHRGRAGPGDARVGHRGAVRLLQDGRDVRAHRARRSDEAAVHRHNAQGRLCHSALVGHVPRQARDRRVGDRALRGGLLCAPDGPGRAGREHTPGAVRAGAARSAAGRRRVGLRRPVFPGRRGRLAGR